MITIMAKGAEANLYTADFSDIFFPCADFGEVVVKERIPKGYRIQELDLQLRRQRTVAEAKIIHDARRSGSNVPAILGVWPESCVILMEKINGVLLRDHLNSEAPGRVGACRLAGRQLAVLHDSGIVHGDPTTSNMILRGDELYLVDFGLAEYSDHVEKRAVDLHLLKTTMKSTHFHEFDRFYRAAVEGYRVELPDAEEVLERCRSIEKRGRYVER
jgi:TP53 regulating kinase-like protein